MSSSVQDILRRIEALSDDDRAELHQLIAARLEAEWKREAAVARRVAEEKNITQEVIDRAVEKTRYGT